MRPRRFRTTIYTEIQMSPERLLQQVCFSPPFLTVSNIPQVWLLRNNKSILWYGRIILCLPLKFQEFYLMRILQETPKSIAQIAHARVPYTGLLVIMKALGLKDRVIRYVPNLYP